MSTLDIAVVGSGYMGGGIAQVLALAGHTVRISDVSGDIARANLDRLLGETAQFVADGLFPADAVERVREHLSAAETIEEAVATADFIEEAVPEKLAIKHETLRRISAAARPDADHRIEHLDDPDRVASPRPSPVPSASSGCTSRTPRRSSPASSSSRTRRRTTDAVEVGEAVVAATGKQSARVKDSTGFVLNRLQYALFDEATKIADEGIATPDDIDTIVRTTFGFRLPFFGPFAIADMAGLDVYAFCFESLQTRWPERFATPPSLQQHVDAGELGTKSGSGYLDVPADRTPELVAYRNRAYVAMQKLLDELGPAPIH